MKKITDESFFMQDALDLAPQLLGKRLVRVVDGHQLVAKIVEVEAYVGPLDKGAHTFDNKRTNRTETMFWRGGHIYVYLIYGMYHCMNIVAANVDEPQAVLIRALEPLEGIDYMHELRPTKKQLNRDLTSGPGKLTRAIDIDMSANGHDLLLGETIYLLDGPAPDEIIAAPRINIDYAEEYKDKPWRFYIAGNPYISKK